MKTTNGNGRLGRLIWVAALSATAAGLNVVCAGSASAYVGPSFLQIPGVAGDWKGTDHKNWIETKAFYWQGQLPRNFGGRIPMYSGPTGPLSGAGTLNIAVGKDNPTLKRLMKMCADKKPIAEMNYAELSVLTRGTFEIGPRPAGIPDYYEYKLKNVEFAGCPVVDGAPEQAFILTFKDIERLNYKGNGLPVEFPAVKPAQLIPASATTPGKSKSFVVSWIAMASEVSEDQCPVMAAKPPQEEYYRYLSKEDAAKEREKYAKAGLSDEQLGRRGPLHLDVTKLPGIIPDPIHPLPQTKIAYGFNLDGDDGTGQPPAGIRKHVNYRSPDGRTGIDNQLYTTYGCISGFLGHKGFYTQFANGQNRDGAMAMLIEVVGIDNEQNDDSIDVVFSYSLDHMAKSASGAEILADYTFTLTDKPQYVYYFSKLHGRIENGVIVTDPVDKLSLNIGQYGSPTELNLESARLRLEITPDGFLKGTLGGYMDWRPLFNRLDGEGIFGINVPAHYNALRNLADGMKDPVSGEYWGVSAAYAIEGSPVFVQVPVGAPKVAQLSTSSAALAEAQPGGAARPVR